MNVKSKIRIYKICVILVISMHWDKGWNKNNETSSVNNRNGDPAIHHKSHTKFEILLDGPKVETEHGEIMLNECQIIDLQKS